MPKASPRLPTSKPSVTKYPKGSSLKSARPAKGLRKKSARKEAPTDDDGVLAEPVATWRKNSPGQLAMPFAATVPPIEAKPFLKWVGGKNSLLSQLTAHFPATIDRYFEPFLGGGAVFFHLKHRFPRLRAFLRDSNRELINAYRAVRDRPEALMRLLDEHSNSFEVIGDAYYYNVRSQHDLTDDLARAARTIFLNKTCFNGLWRVNARNEFNTPVGSNKTPGLYDRSNILAVSAALQDAQLEVQDFRAVAAEVRRGDFIYFDPPYLPISSFSDFQRYTAGQFREADQVELAQLVRELDAKGCQIALSNSEHPRVRELYSGFTVSVVSAPRFINCKPGGRGNIAELVVTNTRKKQSPPLQFTTPAEPIFPETKYMGSKRKLLPFILKNLGSIKFESVLDAFSGSGCVGYALKQTGARVYSNDFLKFCFHTARATVENNSTLLTENDIARLLRRNSSAPTFVRDTYKDIFFEEEDCSFLDNLWANVTELDSPLKVSLALAAASRAAMKKRPRGMFTVTGKKGWDARADLKLSMSEQFLLAVNGFNSSVFSNGQENRAFNCDVFDLDPSLADVVYIDSPYISPLSDCDYTRRYHFVEGYCQYWKNLEIMEHTSTKKIRSYDTAFATKAGALAAFQKLFHLFRKSTLVVSYSSNSIPKKAEMIELLEREKKTVTVFEIPHRYHHGNHAHKIGNNNNEALEYLFIAK
ncbi:MAG: Dam family site-specific DNA-(adenine-N6)-methyltransferase [Verrucomicrobia bacterium]|nr:Dam family site-specific DNA-(adenine-N6)-methyltransferase [Verrucomicrobiota bacterium]